MNQPSWVKFSLRNWMSGLVLVLLFLALSVSAANAAGKLFYNQDCTDFSGAGR